MNLLPLPSGWNTWGAGVLGILTGVITLLTGVVGLGSHFIDPTSGTAMDIDLALKTIGAGMAAITASWALLGIGNKMDKNTVAVKENTVVTATAVDKNTQAVKRDTAVTTGKLEPHDSTSPSALIRTFHERLAAAENDPDKLDELGILLKVVPPQKAVDELRDSRK